jgi:hypothetical protein
MGLHWNKLIREFESQNTHVDNGLLTGSDSREAAAVSSFVAERRRRGVRFFEVEFGESRDVILALKKQHAEQAQAAWEREVGPNVPRMASNNDATSKTLHKMPWVQVFRPDDGNPEGALVVGRPCLSFACDAAKVSYDASKMKDRGLWNC